MKRNILHISIILGVFLSGCMNAPEPQQEKSFYRLNYRMIRFKENRPLFEVEHKKLKISKIVSKAPTPSKQKYTQPKPKKKKAPRLCKVNLPNGYALKAIIRSKKGGHLALLEEATGKGYIVSDGSYVGVTKILVKKVFKDRVIFEEKIKGVRRKYELRLVENAS